MEVEHKKTQQKEKSFLDILWAVKTMKLKIVNQQTSESSYDHYKEKLMRYFLKEGVLQSLSLCKVSYQVILDEFIRLQKTESPETMELYKKNLFKNDLVILQGLKEEIKRSIQGKILSSLNISIENIKYLLKFKGGLRKEIDSEIYEAENENYRDLYYLFDEFVENHFIKFLENLLIPLNEESIVFDDAQKQDEYYFIITYPEEYLMNKFTEYIHQQQSCQQRDNADLLQLSIVFLEDNNSSLISKEDALQMISDIEGKQSQPLTINPKASKSKIETDQEKRNPLINRCNPFLSKNPLNQMQQFQQHKK